MDPQVGVALIRDALQAGGLLLALGAAFGIGSGIWRLVRGPRPFAEIDSRRPRFMQPPTP